MIAFKRFQLMVNWSLILLAGQQVSSAANLVVANLSDSGPGSLRQAIQDNVTLGGGNVIVFSNTLAGAIGLSTGELTLSNNVTITGPGANVLAVNGNGTNIVFDIF